MTNWEGEGRLGHGFFGDGGREMEGGRTVVG